MKADEEEDSDDVDEDMMKKTDSSDSIEQMVKILKPGLNTLLWTFHGFYLFNVKIFIKTEEEVVQKVGPNLALFIQNVFWALLGIQVLFRFFFLF